MPLNLFYVHGRFVKDPEYHTGNNGKKPYTRFTIASSKKYSPDVPDYFDAVAFSDNAERISKYFKKGSPIIIHGHLTTNKRPVGDKNLTFIELICTDFDFVNSSKKPEAKATPAETTEVNEADVLNGDYDPWANQ